MRKSRWMALTIAVLGLVACWMPGVSANTTTYATEEECTAVHQVPCSLVDGNWIPTEEPDLPPDDGSGNADDADEEYLNRQRMAMRVNTSGTLEQPVVAVDMNQVVFPDVQPYLDLEIGRVRVPIRFVAEQMGAAVEWNGDTQEVTIQTEQLTIVLQVDNPTATVNGNPVQTDAPPKLLPPGRVMVPLRFISEAFGANVDWVGEEHPPEMEYWGKYQVWIWVDWGYWGKWNMEERLFVHSWWFYRGRGKQ